MWRPAKDTSLMHLVKTRSVQFGKDFEVNHLPERGGDIRHSATRVDYLRRALGFVPRTALAAGLQATCDDPLARHPALRIDTTYDP